MTARDYAALNSCLTATPPPRDSQIIINQHRHKNGCYGNGYNTGDEMPYKWIVRTFSRHPLFHMINNAYFICLASI